MTVDKNKSTKATGWLFVLPWEITFAGGVNSVVRALAKQAHMNNGKPNLLIQSWEHENPAHSTEEEIPTIRLRLREPGTRLTDFIKYCLTLPKTIRFLRDTARTHNISVINAHYPTTACLTFVLMRRLRLFQGKVIISLHGTEIRNALKSTGITRMMWKLMLQGADRVVVCAESLRNITSQLHSGDNISVIKNGVDLSLVEEIVSQSRQPQPSTRKYILTVGSFDRVKGHDVLLHAFSRIATDYPEIDLTIIGRDSGAKAETETLIATLGLQQRVRLLCDLQQTEVLRYMQHATLFALPSRNESFPLCILEAGAMGAPVIATRVGGVAEIIVDENLGVLVPPEDPQALSNALAAILGDNDKRTLLAANLQAHIKSQLSWKQAYHRYLALVS